MANKNNSTLYSVSKTFIWFAIVSILLTGSLAAIVYLDYNREWKVYQKQFAVLKTQKVQNELKDAESKIDKAKLATLEKQLADAQAVFKSHQKDYQALQTKIKQLDLNFTKTKTLVQNLKQDESSAKYFFEEHSQHHSKKAQGYGKRLENVRNNLKTTQAQLELIEKEKEDSQAKLEEFTANEKSLTKQIEKLLEEKTRSQNKLSKVKPTLTKDILNAPMIDFVAPTLKVQQVVLDNLTDDYHFAKVQKVDRCVTCHLGIDQKGFENAPQPFTTHPKLDLYLSATSPHSMEKFGCTSCHGGNGHSVSFTDSAHTPKNEEQAKEWKKKYHWHELEKWDAKMLSSKYVEASCAKCHNAVVEVPKADKLNKGRALAAENGCLNCHKINGLENRWKVGPDLTNVKSKLDRDWIVKWLDNPHDFRPNTKMPQIFHLSNTNSLADRDRNNAAIESIAAYLVENSGNVELAKPVSTGNSQNGAKLVKELGCLGCHSAPGLNLNPDPAKASDFGPELSGLGSKVSAEWLATWLKNPKHYSKDTRMPNLRLSDSEVADISAYLLGQKNEKFDSKIAQAAKPEVVDELILSSLQGTMRRDQAEDELKKMNPSQRLQFLGKKSIMHQGCFTCHAIKGFEDAKPIGAELSNEGHKDIHQFDFGFTKIERTRDAFITQKLKNPRIYDDGKIKDYYEKLRMPQFNFTDEQIQALTTFVLSQTQERMPLEMQKRLDLKDVQTEKGRLLVQKLNCNGCHTLDGKNGLLRENTDDQGAAPPIIDGEGGKVQEKWLHEFLKNPTPIRPWLHYRMPTFDLSEQELETLVQYFANLAHEEISYKGLQLPASSPDKVASGKVLFEKLQCAKCHEINASSAAMGTSFLAPDLKLTRNRLKPDWVRQWLNDPQVLQSGTMMPTFFADGQSPIPDILGGDANVQIEAIRDYLYEYAAGEGTEKK